MLLSTDEHKVVKELYSIKKRKTSKAKVDSSMNELNKPLSLGLGLGLGSGLDVFSPKAKPKEDSLCYLVCLWAEDNFWAGNR